MFDLILIVIVLIEVYRSYYYSAAHDTPYNALGTKFKNFGVSN